MVENFKEPEYAFWFLFWCAHDKDVDLDNLEHQKFFIKQVKGFIKYWQMALEISDEEIKKAMGL